MKICPQIEMLEGRTLLAVAGTFDLGFSGDGKAALDYGGWNDSAHDVVVQPNGKVIVAGYSSSPQDGPPNHLLTLARYKTNGDLDPTFGTGGKVAVPAWVIHPPYSSGHGFINALALQSDGKIVAAGEVGINGYIQGLLMRFNSDGTLDSSFSGDGVLHTTKASDLVDFRDVAMAPGRGGNGGDAGLRGDGWGSGAGGCNGRGGGDRRVGGQDHPRTSIGHGSPGLAGFRLGAG